ncbi:TetR family transcriptional regulator [Cereibacter ovatus]|uniref:TetR family transcriptional regulator n=1 Tax=Cereibacter ovatus TaxID=439529 RepID=A0A285D0L3_9RHOB|nr:TetR/AcrR family transcriptional regulator [Cereibacter ovatus]SNX73342.1 TetR family transcriptional regulator [Cereibacter ovatus]
MSQIVPPSRKKTASETRRRLLAAAERLSCTLGPAGMSLDAVAAEAGVSKGGLLYHFPSRHALLRALVEDHVAAFAAAMDHHAPGWREAEAPAQALAAARVYVAVVRDLLRKTEAPSSGIFAALTEDPLFMAPLQQLRDEIRGLFARCPDDQTMLAFLACEGILHDRLIDPERWDFARAEGDLDRIDRLLDRIAATKG